LVGVNLDTIVSSRAEGGRRERTNATGSERRWVGGRQRGNDHQLLRSSNVRGAAFSSGLVGLQQWRRWSLPSVWPSGSERTNGWGSAGWQDGMLARSILLCHGPVTGSGDVGGLVGRELRHLEFLPLLKAALAGTRAQWEDWPGSTTRLPNHELLRRGDALAGGYNVGGWWARTLALCSLPGRWWSGGARDDGRLGIERRGIGRRERRRY